MIFQTASKAPSAAQQAVRPEAAQQICYDSSEAVRGPGQPNRWASLTIRSINPEEDKSLEMQIFRLGFIGDVDLNKVTRLINRSQKLFRTLVTDPINNIGDPNLFSGT
jgi:hypothetical protein